MTGHTTIAVLQWCRYLPVAGSECFGKSSQQAGDTVEYPWRTVTLMMESPCLQILITLLKTNKKYKELY